MSQMRESILNNEFEKFKTEFYRKRES